MRLEFNWTRKLLNSAPLRHYDLDQLDGKVNLVKDIGEGNYDFFGIDQSSF